MARNKLIYSCGLRDCMKARQELEACRQFIQSIVDSYPCHIEGAAVVWAPEWLDKAKKLLEADDGK